MNLKQIGDSGQSTDLAQSIHWTENLEAYFASTGEKAHCLAWVHKKAEALYSTRRTFIDLPVIVGSGVIAFLNAGSSSLFGDPQISSIALGIGSLVVGILNTMGTYFGWAKRAEGHRLSAIHYAKLFRFIAVEMALPREERMTPHDFLRYVKDQYDRLAETSPMVPQTILQTFAKKFSKYKDISKPEEANGLEKIKIYIPAATDENRSTVESRLRRSPSFVSDDNNSFVQNNPMRQGANASNASGPRAAPTSAQLEAIASDGPSMPVMPISLRRQVSSSELGPAESTPMSP